MKSILVLSFLLFSQVALSNTTGFKMTEKVPGTIISQFDLKKGDVLIKINNKDVNSLNDVMKFVSDPMNIKSASIIRENKEININYQ